ncbi:PH domain-like protein [Parathielavia appendiculata]|uniref:PH domain-like protein n=1 Tax=Parathielavia appendiculata TaxID=2587402 RepID=A0AAN6TRK3_9PEZI|nr:PH domain-like protein [Parathielavia appendiculata]
MSRVTPRRSRHRHQASNSGARQAAASDYDSDAAQHLESREATNPQPARDNTELSLRVLRRYQPSIRSILAIAANAVAYTFLESTQGWEKHGAEGTLFVCEQEPIVAPTGQVLPRVCVFVLNRRSMENLEVDLLRVTDCEVVGELIVFRLEDDVAGNNHQGEEAGAGKKVLGLWIHADESNTREVHASLILGAWQQSRQTLEVCAQAATAGQLDSGAFAPEEAGADSAAGKRLSMTELFGKKNGALLWSLINRLRSSPFSCSKMTPAMATGGDATRDANHSTASDNVVGPALENQISLVSSFEKWLAQRTEANAKHNSIIAKVQERLNSYKRWLLEAQKAQENVSENTDLWAMNARVRRESDGAPVIVVTGPGADEPIEVAPKDEKELEYLINDGFLGYMIKICHAFAKAQGTMQSLLRTANEVEQERLLLSQPPEVTVNTYIRRLQKYNDIKDIGEQLIGLVAENRGIPVRTLYENGEYGVGMPR